MRLYEYRIHMTGADVLLGLLAGLNQAAVAQVTTQAQIAIGGSCDEFNGGLIKDMSP